MVDRQLRPRGITDPLVLNAMMAIPREWFVPSSLRDAAYENRALPIGLDQTISQPFIVAYMTQLLRLTPASRILEIGTGTGYQTAILALLGGHVFTMERISALRDQAKENFERLNLTNITSELGDGSMGLPQHGPFDRILVTAAAPAPPPSLVEQLSDGGVMAIPVGGKSKQTIVRITRDGSKTIETESLECRFVRLVGNEGWPDQSART